MFIPFERFAPDQDPTQPGVITACDGMFSSLRGMKSVPGLTDPGIDTLAAACVGAGQIVKLDNNTRLFAGITTALYELSTTTWTDRTRAVGGAYSADADDRWRFAVYGNVALAINKNDVLQETSSGAFADVSGAPKASIVERVGDFVFLFDTNEGTFGDSPDRWWCSALGDYTDWTPAIATQCATGRITSIPGPIRAGKRLGDRIVVYKDRGISVGTYTGPAFVWSFADIPGDVGAISQEVVIDLGTEHYFMSRDGFFRFDGVTVAPVDMDIRNWWLARVEKPWINRAQATHDREEGIITWYYPTGGSNTLTEGVIYNYRTGRWGAITQAVQATISYIPAGVTWEGLGSLYSTYDDLPAVPYDTTLFSAGAPVAAFFNTSNQIRQVNGASGNWSFSTGDFGDGQMFSFLTRIIPRFNQTPSGVTLTNYYRASLGDALTTGTNININRGRFDVYRSARWHMASIAGTGTVEVLGADIYFEGGGEE